MVINLFGAAGIKKFNAVLLVLLSVVFSNKVSAQSLGDPIVNITFGSGTQQFPGPLAADSGFTNYTYVAGTPNDGLYTIANSTKGMYGSWWQTTDHTGNPGGYMMIVNCSYAPGIFYTRKVAGLCGGTKYQFAAWLKNLDNVPEILPNVSFSIETTSGTVLGTGTTGTIPTGNNWVQYPFTFTTPANTDSIVIKMTNNAPGGIGNDIAIDDITFRPYGEPVTTVFGQSATNQVLCAGTSQSITVNATSSLPAGYQQKVQMLVNNVWTDQGAPSTATTFTVTPPDTAGNYYYRIVTGQTANINASECVVASNQLTLTVNALPVAAFTGPDTTCFGAPDVFIDKSTSKTGVITKWLWNFGDGQTDTTQNPTHTYSKSGNFNVRLTVSNSNGCTSVAATRAVYISAPPAAAFTWSKPDCAANAITFTDVATAADSTIVSWAWDFGDSTKVVKTNNQPLLHIFATAGTYPVKLSASNNRGCIATITQQVVVSPLPVVNFGTPAVCLADASALFTDSTTIAGNSKLTYSWNFGDTNATTLNPNTSSLQNPTHKYTVAANYTVTLTVTTADGCTVIKSKNFTVNGSVPKAVFHVLNATELCSDRPVSFVNQSTVDFGNITKVEWVYDYTNNPAVVVTDNNPYYGKLYQHQYPPVTNPAKGQNYQVRMMAYSGGVCAAEKDTVITVLASQHLTFPVVPALCINGGPYQLNAAETTGIPGTGVYTGTGVSASGLFDPTGTGIGTTTVQYIFTSTNGCTDTVSRAITVNKAPTVNAGTDLNILEGGRGTFNATATGDSLTYSWTPAINLSDSKILNPVVTPGQNDILYTLTVINSKGCSASGNVLVKVLKSPLVPSAFTPNGDGINDTWVIKYLESYTGATVEVFNRFGQKVYSSIGYTIPWDGRYNNTDLPAGVYYYLINPGHGRKTFSGSVTIIR